MPSGGNFFLQQVVPKPRLSGATMCHCQDQLKAEDSLLDGSGQAKHASTGSMYAPALRRLALSRVQRDEQVAKHARRPAREGGHVVLQGERQHVGGSGDAAPLGVHAGDEGIVAKHQGQLCSTAAPSQARAEKYSTDPCTQSCGVPAAAVSALAASRPSASLTAGTPSTCNLSTTSCVLLLQATRCCMLSRHRESTVPQDWAGMPRSPVPVEGPALNNNTHCNVQLLRGTACC